jgi:radical SAM protein with 4Fe4S-binding SPASM domain
MCGQWSEAGYVKTNTERIKREITLSDWKRVIDELVANNIYSVLLRGGEAFLYPEIIELIEYINSKGVFISIDTNGTVIEKYLKNLLRIGNMHLTFSIDGPEEIHDVVRGVSGSFRKMYQNIETLNELEKESPKKISKSITFTVSPYSYKGLHHIPDIARSLGIQTITVVPYYYITSQMAQEYEQILQKTFGCTAFSVKGFNHEESGIDISIFKEVYSKYRENLKGINNFPYMGSTKEGFGLDDFITWFQDTTTWAGTQRCMNVERFIDIQPNGSVNFCTDFPDVIIGNVMENSIKEIWNSEMAQKFRNIRNEKVLPVCVRCGAKYMSEIPNKIA